MSLSLRPIKADIMRCSVCEENTNCGAVIYPDAAYKHTVWCLVGNSLKHEHFQEKSITLSQSIMNSTGDYVGVCFSCRAYLSERLLISTASIAWIWLVWSKRFFWFLTTCITYNCVPTLTDDSTNRQCYFLIMF